jgi:hypothetical protein
VTKNSHNSNIEIIYEHKQIPNSSITKFLGLNLDNTLTWKNHIDLVKSKLCSACFARSVKPILSQNVLRMIYFSQVHSVLNYGIIFWGNSPHSVKVFKMQKRIIRTITNSGNRDSCRELFRKTEILPFYSQYLFSLILYMVNNKHLFKANMDVHNYETRNKTNFHQPSANLAKYYKGPYYSGIKVFNHLPPYIKELSNDTKCFKNSLKRFFINIFFILWKSILIII